MVQVQAASGDLDISFGGTGQVTTGFFPAGFEIGTAVVVQNDGKLVVAGFVNDANFNTILGVSRYDTSGALDPTFGNGGNVETNGIVNFNSMRVDVALQSDGKIVVVSAVDPGGLHPDFGVLRLNANGTPDPGFGVGGKVTTDFFGRSDLANSVAIQNDGKIVVAGSAVGLAGVADFAIARYDTNGNPDPTFGVGGRLTTDFFGNEDVANGVAIQSDGKIVAAGAAAPDPTFNRDFALARYNGDGTPDLLFDGDGKATTDITPVDTATSVVIQPGDGKIVVAGGAQVPNNIGDFTDFAVLRYDTAGSPDPGFGTGGLVLTDFKGAGDFANDVALQSDGKIVAAGYVQDPADVELIIDFGLARYDTSGNLDGAFGTSGKVITDFGGATDFGEGVAVTPDCKIVVVGWNWQILGSGDSNFALARYQSDGCQVSSSSCPLSHGHWKNDPSIWPVDSLTLGSQSYTKAELLAILDSKTGGDASIILAQQLIAAKLNVLNGSDPTPVSATITHADSVLAGFSGKLPYKVKSSSSSGQLMTTDGAVLTSYNNGLLTPVCNP